MDTLGIVIDAFRVSGLSLLALFSFNVIYELMCVVSTMAMAERRRVLSPLLSAALEPAKLISLLLVMDSANKYVCVGVIMVACVIGNYCAILLMDQIDKWRNKHAPESPQPPAK
jgi:small neutral amino acid transporter SnatA (MarC family)